MARYSEEKHPRTHVARMSLIMVLSPAVVLTCFAIAYHYALISTVLGAIFIAMLSGAMNYLLAIRNTDRVR